LEHVLEHKVEGIPLGDIMQVEGIKVIAVDHSLIMNDISRN
jgi:hypothetical protein